MGESMPKSGAFTFVLHSHLPYTRSAGRWPHGEEWVHEALAETYIPLLNALTEWKPIHKAESRARTGGLKTRISSSSRRRASRCCSKRAIGRSW